VFAYRVFCEIKNAGIDQISCAFGEILSTVVMQPMSKELEHRLLGFPTAKLMRGENHFMRYTDNSAILAYYDPAQSDDDRF